MNATLSKYSGERVKQPLVIHGRPGGPARLIFAGGYHAAMGHVAQATLIINCAGAGFAPMTIPGRCGYIELEWPNFGVPSLGRPEWETILDRIRRQGDRTLIYCFMGRGRTGTALAILAKLSGVCQGNPIHWVRANYCATAIEGNKQRSYLDTLGVWP